jgi:hypothetical protein
MTATPEYTRQAARVIEQAARAEHDFGGWLAITLATVAARLGSSDALTAGRPGSWEADLVDRLVKGTVGWDDHYLSGYALDEEPAPGDAPAATLTAGQLETLAEIILDAMAWREPNACHDCRPGAPCPDYLTDAQMCQEYRALARNLGIEVAG